MREPHELAGELVRLAPRLHPVQSPQQSHRRGHRPMAFGLPLGEHVEQPAGRPEQEELFVAEPEQGRVKSAVQSRLVARVVHGPQTQEGVGDLTPLEVGLAAVHPVWDTGLAQSLLVRLEVGRRAEEQGDVTPAWRARGLGVALRSRHALVTRRRLGAPRRTRCSRLPVLDAPAVVSAVVQLDE
jgi:hypothetical protein